MPYIKQSDRVDLEKGKLPETAGELNYLITKMVHSYMSRMGISYQHFNDVVGALEGCKLELYRRFIAKYEDEKILENGDVNDLDYFKPLENL